MKEKIVLQKIVPTMVVITAVLMFIWYSFTIKSEDVHFDNEPVYELPEYWSVEVNGEEKGVVKAGDTVVYRTIMKRQKTVCNSIMFRSVHQYVRVYLDGEMLLDYGHAQTTPVEMSPGGLWQYARLPNDWEGKELKIELVSYYDSYAGAMPSVLVGTKAGFLFYVIKQALPVLIFMIPVFIMGVMMLLRSFYYQMDIAKYRMRYLGAFTVTSSIWILLESRIVQLVTGKVVLYMNVIFLLFSLFPVFIIFYLRSYPVFGKSRYMKAVSIYMVTAFFFINGMRFFGIIDYMKMVPLVHVGLVSAIIGVVVILIRDKCKRCKRDEENRYLFIALLVFAAFGLLDIFNFYTRSESLAIRYSCMGLFCFVVILRYSAIRQESALMAARMEQRALEKIAYTDMMTGLKNRSAFMEQIEEYKRQDITLVVMMADMNNLKWINDHQGHLAGDQALIQVAELLQKHFEERGACYRIGGDEFCVLSQPDTKENFQMEMELYMEEVEAKTVEGDIHLSISCGFVIGTGRELDAAVAEADKKMYICKTRKKQILKTTEGGQEIDAG